jgi:hypothetical protein
MSISMHEGDDKKMCHVLALDGMIQQMQVESVVRPRSGTSTCVISLHAPLSLTLSELVEVVLCVLCSLALKRRRKSMINFIIDCTVIVTRASAQIILAVSTNEQSKSAMNIDKNVCAVSPDS